MFSLVLAVCVCVVVSGRSLETNTGLPNDYFTTKERKAEFQREFLELLKTFEDILPEIQAEFLSTKYPVEQETTEDSKYAEDAFGIRSRRCSTCGCQSLPSDLSETGAYSWLGFDPNGPGEWRVSLQNIFKVFAIRDMADDSKADAQREFPNSLHNGQGDAFRHALWMYRVTKRYGSYTAKQFGDAHEVSSVNVLSERLMDLYNNKVGRCLGEISSNHSRRDVDVIKDAISLGHLQTTLDSTYSGTATGSHYYGGR
ncbi:uncharacterized protein LOC100370001 [Saccoglossus kowalevskii]|uniref:Uncharacterized protein LOC100370001 n=1 Tax=Saccoglossus kowalevskii TaxID=10224 RepID=A0ABM0GJD9_SACKO|nr:PREDICTED: uncharacterized protein LOC100370001 [Saccoglossus kowalevskii]